MTPFASRAGAMAVAVARPSECRHDERSRSHPVTRRPAWRQSWNPVPMNVRVTCQSTWRRRSGPCGNSPGAGSGSRCRRPTRWWARGRRLARRRCCCRPSARCRAGRRCGRWRPRSRRRALPARSWTGPASGHRPGPGSTTARRSTIGSWPTSPGPCCRPRRRSSPPGTPPATRWRSATAGQDFGGGWCCSHRPGAARCRRRWGRVRGPMPPPERWSGRRSSARPSIG